MSFNAESPESDDGGEDAQITPQPQSNSELNNCSCCPFGYHVDVDFVEYASSMLTPRANPRRVEELRDKRQRRSRPSRSLMLGPIAEAHEWSSRDTENETAPANAAATWTEVDATQVEIGSDLERLSSHMLSCQSLRNGKELQELQEKVKSLTVEIWNLKRDHRDGLKTHGLSSTESVSSIAVAVQVTECDLYDEVGLDSIERSDAGTQVQEILEPEPEFPKAETSKPVSRIPRLKTPTTKHRPVQRSPRTGPSEEMQFAFSVLNEAILNGYTNHNATSALKHVADEWFEVGAAQTGNTAAVREYLHYFEKYYSPQMVRYIVNMVDEVGNTVLHYSVSHGNFEVVSALLDSSACDPDKLNKAGYSALMLVTIPVIKTNTDRSVVRWLLSVGDVNARAAQHGQTTLMLAAAAQERLETVRLVVEAGAEVNLQDEDGSTALMCAAEHGHGDVIRFLLSTPGCDPNLMDNDGYTALAVAMEAGFKELAVMIYAHMNFPEASSTNSSPRSEHTNSN